MRVAMDKKCVQPSCVCVEGDWGSGQDVTDETHAAAMTASLNERGGGGGEKGVGERQWMERER